MHKTPDGVEADRKIMESTKRDHRMQAKKQIQEAMLTLKEIEEREIQRKEAFRQLAEERRSER